MSCVNISHSHCLTIHFNLNKIECVVHALPFFLEKTHFVLQTEKTAYLERQNNEHVVGEQSKDEAGAGK